LHRGSDNYYTIDFKDLDNKLSAPENKMMILCSPHNPVGRVWARDELFEIGRLCQKHDVVLVSDEIHSDIIRKDQKHTCIATLFPGSKNIVTCTSPSKTFNLAGLGLCNTIVPNPEHRAGIIAAEGEFLLQNPISIVAAQAAYEMGDKWVDELNEQIDLNFAMTDAFIKDSLPQAAFAIPEGTYLGWLDVSAYNNDSEKLESDLITNAGVMLEGGTRFSDGGEGFMRLNCACPPALLMDGLNRVARYLSSLCHPDKPPEGQTMHAAEDHTGFLTNEPPAFEPAGELFSAATEPDAFESYLPACQIKTSDRCTACGLCVTKCPVCAIDPNDPRITDPMRCTACYMCVSLCPQGARKR
jgi:cystathionine beta-lyase